MVGNEEVIPPSHGEALEKIQWLIKYAATYDKSYLAELFNIQSGIEVELYESTVANRTAN